MGQEAGVTTATDKRGATSGNTPPSTLRAGGNLTSISDHGPFASSAWVARYPAPAWFAMRWQCTGNSLHCPPGRQNLPGRLQQAPAARRARFAPHNGVPRLMLNFWILPVPPSIEELEHVTKIRCGRARGSPASPGHCGRPPLPAHHPSRSVAAGCRGWGESWPRAVFAAIGLSPARGSELHSVQGGTQAPRRGCLRIKEFDP